MGAPRIDGVPPAIQDWADKLAKHVDSIVPVGGSDIDVSDSVTGQGRVVSLRITTNTGGNANRTPPSDFQLYNATDGTDLAVGIRFGNLTPNGIQLADGVNPYPDDFDNGDGTIAPTTELGVSASGIVYVAVSVDTDPAGDGSEDPNVSGISLDTASTLPNYDDSNGYMTLGTFSVDNSTTPPTLTVLNSNGIGSQVYGYCGGKHYFDSAGPGNAGGQT